MVHLGAANWKFESGWRVAVDIEAENGGKVPAL